MITPNDAEDAKKLHHSHFASGNIECPPFWKNVWQFLLKLNTYLPYASAIIPERWKSGFIQAGYMNSYNSSEIAVPQNWKQPKGLSRSEWINKQP